MKQFIKNTFTPGQAGKTLLLGLLMAISGATGSLHAADIVLQAEETGTLSISNQWIAAVNILKGTTEQNAIQQGTIAGSSSLPLSVNKGDVIIVRESTSGSTFRVWSRSRIPLVAAVPCKITFMPAMSAFTSDASETTAGDNFFSSFNYNGLLTSLPDGSFNTANITSVGDGFFSNFNYGGSLKLLPAGSFNTENIKSVGSDFFSAFNNDGSLRSLPDGSFNTENITSVGDNFFAAFNNNGSLNKVPTSFKLPKALTTVGTAYCENMFFDSPMTVGTHPLYFYAEAVDAFGGTTDITPETVPAGTTVYVNVGTISVWKGAGVGSTDANKHLWSFDANWEGGAAPAGRPTIIYHADAIDLHVDDTHTAASISNATTAGLTVLPGASLTIAEWDDDDNVTTGGGSILIQAEEGGKVNGTFLVPEGTVVNATVEFQSRAINTIATEGITTSKMQWQYFGIPVETAVANSFYGAWVREFAHTEEGTNEEGGTTYTYWHWLKTQDDMLPTKGYEISVPQGHSGRFGMAGILLTDGLFCEVPYNEGDRYAGQWVLSNPFTAGLKVRDIVFGSGTEFENSVWLFNTGSSTQWTGGTGDAAGQYTVIPANTDRVIPSMQGFVVKLSGAAGGIITLPYPTAAATMPTLRSQQRQRGAQAAQESQESQTTAHEKIYTDIALLSADGLLKDRMQLYTDPRTTRSYDNGWDGRKMFGGENLAALFSPEADGNYQVNARPDVDNTYLSVKAETGTRDYALRFVHHNTADTYDELWLRDLELGIDVDITADSSVYHFTAENEKAATRRFRITSSRRDGEEGAATGIEVYRNNTTGFLVRNHYTTAVVLHIYSASGHLLASREVPPLSDTSLSGSDFPQGVYLVEGRTESGERSVAKMVTP